MAQNKIYLRISAHVFFCLQETNLQSMNDALNCIGIRITAPSGNPSNGEWSISDGKSLTRYSDGVVIPAKGQSFRGQQVLDAFRNKGAGPVPGAPNAMVPNMGGMPGFMPMPGMPGMPPMHPAMMMGMGYGGRGGGRGGRGQRFTPY
jgi:hypothetical protein